MFIQAQNKCSWVISCSISLHNLEYTKQDPYQNLFRYMIEEDKGVVKCNGKVTLHKSMVRNYSKPWNGTIPKKTLPQKRTILITPCNIVISHVETNIVNDIASENPCGHLVSNNRFYTQAPKDKLYQQISNMGHWNCLGYHIPW